MTTRTRRITLTWGVIALAAACSGDATVAPGIDTPQPLSAAAANVRTLAIELTKPAADDAGMIFSVDGPNILGVEPVAGIDLVSHRADSPGKTTIDVLVAGPLESGVIARLTVKGVNSGNPFTARLREVAAGAGEGFVQRTDLSAYRLIVRR